MSRRQEIADEMYQMFGCYWVIRKQVAEYMGYTDPHNIDHIIKPLQSNGKKYRIQDVAEQIAREMR